MSSISSSGSRSALQQLVRRYHSDLYRDSRDRWPTVIVDRGQISATSVGVAPFGYDFELPLEETARKVV